MVWLNAAKGSNAQARVSSLDLTMKPLNSLAQILTVRLVSNCVYVTLIPAV